MIGYVTMGTNDIAKAAPFYDALAKELGVGRFMDFGSFIAWGNPTTGGAGFAIAQPHDKKAATVGNGSMAAFTAKDKAQVDRLHALALSLGGTCEGPPGPRSDNFYAAYFRDLDGNKLNAFVMS